jgi:hypothetical protein
MLIISSNFIILFHNFINIMLQKAIHQNTSAKLSYAFKNFFYSIIAIFWLSMNLYSLFTTNNIIIITINQSIKNFVLIITFNIVASLPIVYISARI